MKAKCAALLAGMLLLSATRAGATTYAVSLFDGFHNIAVGGSITTDGNTGSLALTDIVDWNLIGVSENSILQVLFNLTGPLSGDNSFINAATFSNIVATPTTLSLGIPAAELQFVATMSLMQPSIGGIIFESFTPPPPPPPPVPPPLIPQALGGFEVCLGAVLCASSTFSSDPANFVIGDGKVVPSTVPLPAALPLFATGLGALGLLGWRRKRKAA